MVKWIVLILAGWMFTGTCEKQAKPEYVVIERDYGGTILLDAGTGVRYLQTDDGIYEIEMTWE